MPVSRFASVPLVLALAACTAGGSLFVQQQRLSERAAQDFSAIAARGDVDTVVVGNPFVGNDREFAERVAATFSDRYGRGVTFAATDGWSTRPGYRLVAVLNPDPPLTGSALCRAPQAPPVDDRAQFGAADGRIAAQLVLCNGGAAVSVVRGRSPEATPDVLWDPLFEEFLVDGLLLLLQPDFSDARE